MAPALGRAGDWLVAFPATELRFDAAVMLSETLRGVDGEALRRAFATARSVADRDDDNPQRRVPDAVRHVMREGAERERVLVERLGTLDQRRDEIAAADVMQQIGEEMIAQRELPQIGDVRPAVGKGPRPLQRVCVGAREAAAERRGDGVVPGAVDDRLMREYGKSRRWPGQGEKEPRCQTEDRARAGPLSEEASSRHSLSSTPS